MLLSYADKGTPEFRFWIGDDGGLLAADDAPRPDVREEDVFVDSGAFAVFTRGASISLGEYADFLLRNSSRVSLYASLDVIGDWQASAANVSEMRRLGLDPVPTFHRGSPWPELERLVAEHAYVAIGGLAANVAKPGERLHFAGLGSSEEYLDRVFDIAGRHWPVRLHAFGVISQRILERYPFCSADSSSAERGGGFGEVMAWRRGTFDSHKWHQPERRKLMDGEVTDLPDRGARSARIIRNVGAITALERYVTDLWAAKGVTW